MTTHKIKITPLYFNAVYRGDKTFEVRLHDRKYQPGDNVILREWNGQYTGREIYKHIPYVYRGPGVKAGYCILSILSPY